MTSTVKRSFLSANVAMVTLSRPLLGADDVGVGPGRGAGITPARPPRRTCDSHRIRRSTDCRCYAGTEFFAVLVHGVGMLWARH